MKIIKLSAAKDKIQKYKIEDPFLKVFIEKFEKIVPWGQIESQEGLVKYIENTLLYELYDMIDPKSETSNYLKDVDIKKEFNRNMDNPIVQQAHNAYLKNPEEAKKIMLHGFNQEKKEAFMAWWKYMLKENDVYSKNPAFLYIMLKPIFDSSPADRKNAPLSLNAMAVAQVYGKIQAGESQINLFKSYRKSLVDAQTAQDKDTGGDDSDGWVRIPSLKNDKENFEDNITKLKDLSKPRGWCTGNTMARPYLSEGDFWIYVHDGQARVAVRFVGERIREIQGDKNTRPFDYWQEIMEFVEKNGFDKESAHYKELAFAKELNDNLDKDPEYIKVFREKFMEDPKVFERLTKERQQHPDFLEIPLQYWEHKIQEGPEHDATFAGEYRGRLDFFNKTPEEIKANMNNELIYLIYNDIERDFDRDVVRTLKTVPQSHDFLEKLDMRQRVVGLIEREIQKTPWVASLVPPEFQMDIDPELMKKSRGNIAYDLLVDLENNDSNQNPEEILEEYYDSKFDKFYEQDQDDLDLLKHEGEDEDLEVPMELLDAGLMHVIVERLGDYWYSYIEADPTERYDELENLLGSRRSSDRYDDWDDYSDIRELVENAWYELVMEDPKKYDRVPEGFLDYMTDDGLDWYIEAWLNYLETHPEEMFNAKDYIYSESDLEDYWRSLFSKHHYPLTEAYFTENPDDFFDDDNYKIINENSEFIHDHKEYITNLARSYFKDTKTTERHIDTLEELNIEEIIPEKDYEQYEELAAQEAVKQIELKPIGYMTAPEAIKQRPEAIKAWMATAEKWIELFNSYGEQLIERNIIPKYVLEDPNFQLARKKKEVVNRIKGADKQEIYNFSKNVAPYKNDAEYYQDAFNWLKSRYTDLVLDDFMYGVELGASRKVPDELRGETELIERLVNGIYYRVVNDLHKTHGKFHEIDPLIRDPLADKLYDPIARYRIDNIRGAFRLAKMLSEIYPVYPEKFQGQYDRIKNMMIQVLTDPDSLHRDVFRHDFLEKFPTLFNNDIEMINLAKQIATETHNTDFVAPQPVQREVQPETQEVQTTPAIQEGDEEVMAHNWYKNRTVKLAQGIEFIDHDQVLDIIEGFNSRRFTIGFRKADGSLRMMNSQMKVQRPYDNSSPDGYTPNSAYLTLYDLQIASQIARENLADIDVNDFDDKLLRKAYRRVYPHTVELIKGNGRTYVVRGSIYARENNIEEFEEIEDENI